MIHTFHFLHICVLIRHYPAVVCLRHFAAAFQKIKVYHLTDFREKQITAGFFL
jgi:hypothetical protein